MAAILKPLNAHAISGPHRHLRNRQDPKFQYFELPKCDLKRVSCRNTLTLLPFYQRSSSSLPPLQGPLKISDFGLLLASEEPVLDVSLFSQKINEFLDSGLFEDAVRVYIRMLECGLPAVEFQFFPRLMKAFGGISDVQKARQIHGHVLKLGVLDDVNVVNSVLGMYWKCGAADHAYHVFEKMIYRDLVTWNTMVSGTYQRGDFCGSLMIFSRMVREFRVFPNRVACLSTLSSCASVNSLIHGREIHGFLVKSDLELDEFLVSSLIDMYMKCGKIIYAENVFCRIMGNDSLIVNPVIWNAMIFGYVSNGFLSEARVLLAEMNELSKTVDSSTMVAALVLCSHSLDCGYGEQIHGLVCKFGMEEDIRVATALADMYFNCSNIEAGQKIFTRCPNRNLVMWGAIVSSYVQSGLPMDSLDLCHTFIEEYGYIDSILTLAALRACSSLAFKQKGMELHGLAIKLGFVSDVFIGSALVDLYAKCGDIESAQIAFLGLPVRDLISWNAIIFGYSQHDLPGEALNALRNMQLEDIKPNTVTISSILSVCAQISAFKLCKEVHGFILRHGYESNVLASNSLISTYAKCGDIHRARIIFYNMQERNQISWNSILVGLGMHGQTDEMFDFLERMKLSDVMPDHATFTALLSACSHSGRVDQGWKYFTCMVKDYKLEPRLEHYTCMVDLLGRAGHLDQAYDLIKAMPFAPDDRIWGSLLASCKTHGNERLAEIVAGQIFELEPDSVGYRVLLANLYELYGRQIEVNNVRSDIKDRGLKKQPGCSWIEIDGKMHIFIASDHSHCQSQEIYFVLNSLTREIMRLKHIR